MIVKKSIQLLALSSILGGEQSSLIVQAKEETIACEVDQDCKSLNQYFICMPVEEQYEDGRQKECIHKPLFPLENKEIVGTFVFSLIMCLSNVAGIGGGGVAIPLAMTFFNFSMKPAIAVSSFSIMISTLARFFFNFSERHPEKSNCTSIDYNMTNVMMPLTLLGSLIGAYVYVSFPDLVLQVLLTLLLLVLTFKSGQKGIQIYKKESSTQEMKVPKQVSEESTKSDSNKNSQEIDNEGGNIEMANKVNEIGSPNNVVEAIAKEENPSEGEQQDTQDDHGAEKTTNAHLKEADKEPSSDPVSSLPELPTGDAAKDKEIKQLKKLIKQEESHGQWKKQFLNFACLLCLLTMSLLRGGKSEFSFEKCSTADWVAVSCFGVLMILIVVAACNLVGSEQALKEKYNNINLVPSDLKFKGEVLRNVLALGFGGGWVAGALGLGGGAIFNPLLLSMGVPPKVSSATGMYLITFSKIAACLIYFIFGELQMDYCLWIAAWSTLGALLGLKGANWYMEKFGRQSIIVFCLTFILGISTIGVPIFGGLDLYHKHENGESITSFKSIC